MNKFPNPSGFRVFFYLILAASLFLTAFQTQPAGGISPVVWIVIIVILIIIIWLFLRSRRGTTTPERVTTPEEPAPIAPVTPTTPDDLTIIEGIGPKIASMLQSAGITTFSQLAATDVTRLRGILDQAGLRIADPKTWPEQARLAAAGDMAGLKALQDRLNAGREV